MGREEVGKRGNWERILEREGTEGEMGRESWKKKLQVVAGVVWKEEGGPDESKRGKWRRRNRERRLEEKIRGTGNLERKLERKMWREKLARAERKSEKRTNWETICTNLNKGSSSPHLHLINQCGGPSSRESFLVSRSFSLNLSGSVAWFVLPVSFHCVGIGLLFVVLF